MIARARLEALVLALLDASTDDEVEARIAAEPDAPALALAYLRDRHIHGVAPAAAWETSTAFEQLLGLLLGLGGTAAARELIEVALSAGHLRELRPVGALVMDVVPPDELAALIVDALRADGSAPRRAAARELAYHTFEAAGDAYAASPAARAQLAQQLADPAA